MSSVVFEILKMVVEIIALTILIYQFYTTLMKTNAISAVYILFVYILLMGFTKFFALKVLDNLLRYALVPVIILLIVVYQSDFKYILNQLTTSASMMRRRDNMLTNENLTQIVMACFSLANIKRGALIVICRNDSLSNIEETGTLIDGSISSALLLTIFDHDTPLHDGAVIIDNNKIIAAGCYLPLSEQTSIKSTLGTRHRAAIGMSEETDSITLVVSEETRTVSVCYSGSIQYDLDMENVKKTVLQLMTYNRENKE